MDKNKQISEKMQKSCTEAIKAIKALSVSLCKLKEKKELTYKSKYHS